MHKNKQTNNIKKMQTIRMQILEKMHEKNQQQNKQGVKKMSENIKERTEKLCKIIESCWDENNPNDGLTFDQRLEKKLSKEDYNMVTGDY